MDLLLEEPRPRRGCAAPEKCGFSKGCGGLCIGTGWGRWLDRAQSQMIENPGLPLELLSEISLTAKASRLDEHHRRESLPTVELAAPASPLELLSFYTPGKASVNKLERLPKNCVMVPLGLILLLCW